MVLIPDRPSRLATGVAIAAAVGFAAFAMVRGTWAVGGSDSSCYALMADAFARGELQPRSGLTVGAPWPEAARTLAPAGFIPSPVRADAASPICAPGFSLVLAPLRWAAGRDAIFLVTPLTGALLVWLSFVLGRQIANSATGTAAAAIVATIPVALFQVTQPMNDIAVTTLWMAILVSASSAEPSRPWLLGALTGLALVVRPNLAPAAVVVGLWLLVTTWRIRAANVGMVRRCAVAFAVAALPFVALMIWLNIALYGHPLQSGYGSTRDLFRLDHVPANLRNYGSALVQTQLGLPLVGAAALLTVRRSGRAIVWLTLWMSASVVAVYLLYRPFAEWWYLRFLLPALVPLTVLAAAAGGYAITYLVRSPAVRAIVVITAVIAIARFGLVTARNRQAFDLYRLEGRFRLSGDVARERLPVNAVFVTVWHSGTVRFHASRLSVLWDSLEPSAFDEAITWLSSRGLEPYLLLERWEEPIFRERFSAYTRLGNLDWPPRFDIDRQVRIFRVSDRDPYMRGDNIRVEYITGRSRRSGRD